MTFERRRWLAAMLLLAGVALGAGWLLSLDYGRKLSTDVLDLIPAGERDPELAIVRRLASETEARTMLLVLTDASGRAAPLEKAQAFAAELRKAKVFAQAIALGDPAWRDGVGRELFELRFALLFPSWLKAHASDSSSELAQTAAWELKVFLEKPEALAYQDLVPADPLLLLPQALERMKGGLALVQPAGEEAGRASGLVWAQLAVSPLSEAGQGPAFAAIESAVRTVGPEWRVTFTGVNRFAAASRARIEREISWLNTASLVAVLAVALIFVRRAHRALHLAPVIALSTLGAWVATTLVFERVHVIVFVLGALLAGVAIDYGFYLFMQPPARPDEPYPEKVKRLAKPLLASCFTTVAGFALLLISELPMIRQLGVFVGAGLLAALAGAVLYFATVREPFLAAREFKRGGRAIELGGRGQRGWWVLALWVLAVAGLARLSWRDDIRELEVPARGLQEEDARIRAAFGQRGDRAVYLTHGESIAAARESLGAFEAWATKQNLTVANLGPLVPTAAERAAVATFLTERKNFPAELRAALAAEGFEAEGFEAFFTAFSRYASEAGAVQGQFENAVERLRASLPGPLGLLLHVSAGKTWFVTLASAAPPELPPVATNTVAAGQLQSLNRLFTNYRASALRLSLIGLAIVGVGVFLTYGLRDGVRIFAIPCGACLGVFGVFGWLGQPLNLFHLLGAFLGVCLTHNYSIFTATSAYRGEPPPVSVRLSALTTAASFGVLALSGIPVVRALGVTVTAMVVAALLVIELEHLSPLGGNTVAKAPSPSG